MPVLSNPRHERFAQEMAKGSTGRDAYLSSGYDCQPAAADVNASKLLRHTKVAARIAELQEGGAKRAQVTVESLLDEAEQVRALAVAAEQYPAAIAAIREKGVLSGKRVERSERGMPGEFADIENMSADELRAYIARDAAEAGLCEDAVAAGTRAGSPRGKPH